MRLFQRCPLAIFFNNLMFFSFVQELLAEKTSGASRVHQTVELGEKLYPHTAVEGREMIRQELRALRDKWETFTDSMADTQRRLEVTYNRLLEGKLQL